MKVGDLAIVAARQQDVPVEAPGQVRHAHHAEVHHNRKRLSELGLPHGNSGILGDYSDNAVAVELRPARLVQPRVYPRYVYRTPMAGQTGHELPGGALQEGDEVLAADATAGRRDERAVRGPGEPTVY